jgi:hypothetical protein
MRLVYEKTNKEVRVGDTVTLRDGEEVMIGRIEKPHKPSSTGKVYVTFNNASTQSYYPSVVGAKWIDREDRVESLGFKKEVISEGITCFTLDSKSFR